MPDPRMSANQIDLRFQGVENLLARYEKAITNLSGLLGNQEEKLMILSARIEELEEALDEL